MNDAELCVILNLLEKEVRRLKRKKKVTMYEIMSIELLEELESKLASMETTE